MLTQFQGKNSSVKIQTDSFQPVRVSFVFKLMVIITWIILFLPTYPLLTYTSVNKVVWNKYSVPYASMLVIYFGLLLLWPLVLALPGNKVRQVSRIIIDIKQQPWLYVQYIVAWVVVPQIILLIIPLWGWGYNSLLRFAILLMGLWLSVLPGVWGWGLGGWKIRVLSRIFALHHWMVQNVFLWVRPAVAGGVLLLSVALALLNSADLFWLILLLLLGTGIIIIFMRWPSLGLLAVIGSLTVPIRGPSGLSVTMLLVALLFGLWLMDMIVRQRLRLVESGPTRPLLVFVLIATLAFGMGQLPWYTFASSAPLGAQMGGLALHILSAAAFLLVAHQVRDIRWLERMTWVLLALGGLYMLGQLVPGASPLLRLFPGGSIKHSMFYTWVVVLAFSQVTFNRQLALPWRLMLFGLLSMSLYYAVVQNYDWKSGWLPALAAMAAVVSMRWWRLAPIAGLFGLLLVPGLAVKVIESDAYSYSTRVEAWLIVVEIAKVNPILGLGPANYYWYTPLFPIRGYAVQFNSHSQYVDLFAQTGLLGLIGFLWFFGTVGWLAWKLRDRVPQGFPRAYVYGALGGLAGTIVAAALGDWVIPFFYNITMWGFRISVLPWLFLGGLVALEQMYIHKESKADSRE